MHQIFAFAQRTRRAIALYGVGGALARAAKAVQSPTKAPAARAFDEQFGVETAGVVRLERLQVRGDRRLGVHYQPSEPHAVRELLERLPVVPDDYTFIDIGSGKGLVVLIAAQMPFKRVIGVEFSEELDTAARANLAAFPASARRCATVELVCMDAAQFLFPPGPLVLYFYNPFLEPVMRAVMTNLADSLDRSPRPVYVVMTGDPSLADVVLATGFTSLGDGTYARV